MGAVAAALLGLAPAVAALEPEAAKLAAPPRAPLPIQAFAELPSLEDPELSPSGKLIAAKIARDGKQYFAILPTSGEPARLIPEGDIDFLTWRWINDEWLVVGVGHAISIRGIPAYITRSIGVNAVNGSAIKLAGNYDDQSAADIIWSATDGSARILMLYASPHPSDGGITKGVQELDLATGKKKVIESPRSNIFYWRADGSGTVRLGYGLFGHGLKARIS